MPRYFSLHGAEMMNTVFFPIQNLQKQLEETFSVKFNVHTEEPIRMIDSNVVLEIPEETKDWKIVPSKLPPFVRL